MAYSPPPGRRPPPDVLAFALTFGAVVCLFTFAPVIVRHLMGT